MKTLTKFTLRQFSGMQLDWWRGMMWLVEFWCKKCRQQKFLRYIEKDSLHKVIIVAHKNRLRNWKSNFCQNHSYCNYKSIGLISSPLCCWFNIGLNRSLTLICYAHQLITKLGERCPPPTESTLPYSSDFIILMALYACSSDSTSENWRICLTLLCSPPTLLNNFEVKWLGFIDFKARILFCHFLKVFKVCFFSRLLYLGHFTERTGCNGSWTTFDHALPFVRWLLYQGWVSWRFVGFYVFWRVSKATNTTSLEIHFLDI